MQESSRVPEGTVVRLYSDWADVALDAPGGPGCAGEIVPARLRGRLERAMGGERSPLAVGDRVVVALSGSEAVIESRGPRRTKLSRQHPHDEHQEQVVAANVDRVLVVASPLLPPLKHGLVDRYLVAASAEGLPAALCLSKCDLVDDDLLLDALLAHWVGTGLPVFRTRHDDPASVERLREGWLAGHATVLVGQSGVGKSTLRNLLLPRRAPAVVAEISGRTSRGKHCTTAATFEPLEGGGYLVDTPGVKEFGVWKLRASDAQSHFPEFADVSCRFSDCRHGEDPGCALRPLVEKGLASPGRLISLLVLQATLSGRRPGGSG